MSGAWPAPTPRHWRWKNATDAALIIDAMDLLHAGTVDGFVIVSSDSDYTRLATRIRESGVTVHGIGRPATPPTFMAACDRFSVLGLPPMLRSAITATAKDDGWSHLSEVGSYLLARDPAFDPRDHGHARLGALMRAQSDVEVADTRVRLKPPQRAMSRSSDRRG